MVFGKRYLGRLPQRLTLRHFPAEDLWVQCSTDSASANLSGGRRVELECETGLIFSDILGD